MKFDTKIGPCDIASGRKSIRLKGYDYSQAGGYFVSIVTHGRECLFGEVARDGIRLYDLGGIVQECCDEIPSHFRNVDKDAFIIMPNHVHGIIFIHENDGRTAGSYYAVGARHASPLPGPRGPLPHSLGAIMRSFKSAVTRRAGRELGFCNIWQHNYVSRVLCGITNTLSATRPITKESPGTYWITR
jgi:REP element-mobilizing transposase RayT